MRQRILSVTKKDLIRQTFRAGGNGGQNQNKRDTGVRWIHPPSGARGEARDQRSQAQNERSAFLRLVNSREFQTWLKIQTGQVAAAEADVSRALAPENLRVEVRRDGRWVPAEPA